VLAAKFREILAVIKKKKQGVCCGKIESQKLSELEFKK